jgi:hypothetical protein
MLCRGWIVRGVVRVKRSRASNLPSWNTTGSCRIDQARRKRLQPCWGRLRGGRQKERVEYRRLGRDLQVPHYIRAIISPSSKVRQQTHLVLFEPLLEQTLLSLLNNWPCQFQRLVSVQITFLEQNTKVLKNRR